MMANLIREIEASQRPRERLRDLGPGVLSDAELIAVLLRTGRRGHNVVDTAQQLIFDMGGLAAAARMGVHELSDRPGFGPAEAATRQADPEQRGTGRWRTG